MNNVTKLILSIMILFTINSFAQNQRVNNAGNRMMMGGTIKGKVYDSVSKEPIVYANVVIFSSNDSVNVGGTVSTTNGEFELTKIRPGTYYLDVRFIGFETQRINNLQLSRGNNTIEIGEIFLKPNSLLIDGVEVVGEKSQIEFKIDKKVINVSKQYTAASGSAVEVLENVPSVTVDIEGNVKLRGSSNFTVLIDNRPSVLDANDALKQIPASSIENIEIITNPSAKFDPEGPSGIINLVMKKEGLTGSSGTINLNGGLYNNLGGDFLYNFKSGITSTYFGANYNQFYMPGNSENNSYTTFNSQTSFLSSTGSSNRGRNFYSFRGGIDFNFNPSNFLGFSARYGNMNMNSSNKQDYQSWNSFSPDILDYLSLNSSERVGEFFSLSLDYKYSFETKGNEISFNANLRKRDMDENSTDELYDFQNRLTSGRIISENGPSTNYQFKLDYVLPIGVSNKFEAGVQSQLNSFQDENEFNEFNLNLNKYIFFPEFSRNIEYKRNIHSLYSLYSGEIERFGYQAGLRGEYTDRKIILKEDNNDFTINRWDYFPTLHFSYKLSDADQFITSYTRRINRPQGWNLEPFQTWIDNYNIRIGNPALAPEYINSFETGYQHYFGRSLLSLEGYYRITENKIENIRSVFAENVTLHTVQNVGKDFSLGAEIMFDYGLFDWWNINLIGNIFDYRVEGIFDNRNFLQQSTNWNTRFNNTFNIGKLTRIQFNNSFESPSVSTQGRREGFYTASVAIRYEIISNLNATLQFRDVFSTAKNEFTSKGIDFYSYSYSVRKAPSVMLNLSYNINNYREKRNRDSNAAPMGEDDDF